MCFFCFQVEVYDPSLQYCADELLVPSVSPIITPPRENFELVRDRERWRGKERREKDKNIEACAPASWQMEYSQGGTHMLISIRPRPSQHILQLQAAFQADQSSLDDESHDLIIYCSRSDAHERVVANEVALLALIRQHFPESELYVYTGAESVAQTVRLFRRASVVMGMHGAGLSHLVFAPRGAAVVEFLFMPDPPLMFWHAAASLQQHYIMVPLPQSWWLEKRVVVNTQDVVDALALAVNLPAGDCPLGEAWCWRSQAGEQHDRVELVTCTISGARLEGAAQATRRDDHQCISHLPMACLICSFACGRCTCTGRFRHVPVLPPWHLPPRRRHRLPAVRWRPRFGRRRCLLHNLPCGLLLR